MTFVIYRLFFHDPMPAKLNPTLFILIAPPAVGALSWLALNGGKIDAAVHIFFSTALFITLLLAVQTKTFLRTPFFLSAWAYSFPLAAITITTLEMYLRSGSDYLLWLGCAMLAAATLVIAVLIVKTLQAVLSGSAFVPD
jgi:tellurite resistance protein